MSAFILYKHQAIANLLLIHLINISISLIDYLLECIYSEYIMFINYQREHYDVYFLFNNGSMNNSFTEFT